MQGKGQFLKYTSQTCPISITLNINYIISLHIYIIYLHIYVQLSSNSLLVTNIHVEEWNILLWP